MATKSVRVTGARAAAASFLVSCIYQSYSTIHSCILAYSPLVQSSNSKKREITTAITVALKKRRRSKEEELEGQDWKETLAPLYQHQEGGRSSRSTACFKDRHISISISSFFSIWSLPLLTTSAELCSPQLLDSAVFFSPSPLFRSVAAAPALPFAFPSFYFSLLLLPLFLFFWGWLHYYAAAKRIENTPRGWLKTQDDSNPETIPGNRADCQI